MNRDAMDCERVVEWIDQLADEERSEGHPMPGDKKAAAAGEHLKVCRECRDHFEFVQALSKRWDENLGMPPDAYFEKLPSQILTRIHRESVSASEAETQSEARQSKSSNWMLWAVPLAASVLVFVLGRQVFQIGLAPQVQNGQTETPANVASEPSSSEAAGLSPERSDGPLALEGASETVSATTGAPSNLGRSDASSPPSVPDVNDSVARDRTAVPEAPVSEHISGESKPSPAVSRSRVQGAAEASRTASLTESPGEAPGLDPKTPPEVSAELPDEAAEQGETSWVGEQRAAPVRRRFTSNQLDGQGQRLPGRGNNASARERGAESAEAGSAEFSAKAAEPLAPNAELGLVTDPESRASRDFEALLSRSNAQRIHSGDDAAGADTEGLVSLCASWDDHLRKYPQSSRLNQVLYERAACHLASHERESDEKRRDAAIEAARDFLQVGSEVGRIQEIQRGLERIQ